jgi:hypothetical protein
VLYPDDLVGESVDPEKLWRVQRLQLEGLREAESEFITASVPLPTEYRISYEPSTGKMDAQVSREIKYAHHPTQTASNGPEDWLELLPKVYGKYSARPGEE